MKVIVFSCVRVCVCVRACVRACMRACVCVCACASACACHCVGVSYMTYLPLVNKMSVVTIQKMITFSLPRNIVTVH